MNYTVVWQPFAINGALVVHFNVQADDCLVSVNAWSGLLDHLEFPEA